jgi:predicted DCC family thiol-disulfide oxidoreductase YuxK
MTSPTPASQASRALLLYDGDCPFCSRYGAWVRLRDRYGLTLLDARQQPGLVEQYAARGYDIDRGMILEVDGRLYHGAAAIVMLDAMTSPLRPLDRLARVVVRVPGLVRLLYPLIRLVRVVTLRLMGRPPDIRRA